VPAENFGFIVRGRAAQAAVLGARQSVAYERSISMDVFVSHYFKEDQTNFNNICYAFQQEGIEA
jgi:hypothetical protein